MLIEHEEILLTEDVAEMLRVSKGYVCKLFKEGRIKGFHVGKTWRTSRAAVQNYVDSQLGEQRARDSGDLFTCP